MTDHVNRPHAPLPDRIRRFFVVVWLLPGLVLFPACVTAQTEDQFRYLDLFGNVLERVRAEYVEEVTDKELIEAAISGMLGSLDPHSSYLNPDMFSDMQVQTRGQFGGLGIEVTMENGLVKVVSPIDDTPASRANLQPNDLITHLDGDPVLGLSLSEAVDRMRGPVDTEIVLTIRRDEDQVFDVTLKRDVIRIRSVRSRVINDVGIIRITNFSGQTSSTLEDAIDDIKTEVGSDLAGFVLDLRRNPGGLLDEAVAVSDAFLERGEIVSSRNEQNGDGSRFNAKPGDLTDGMPIVVLIDNGSASASEIVAGALQDHRRAVIMGTTSFGKGSVQTIMPVQFGGAIRLTTQYYYTPSGRSIQGTGIVPDIEVPVARIETLDVGDRREADLRGALSNPNDAPEGEGTGDDAEEGEASALAIADTEDYQLERALDLLRGLALFK